MITEFMGELCLLDTNISRVCCPLVVCSNVVFKTFYILHIDI